MASIQDPLTDLPPPSRLDLEELSNFCVDRPSAAPACVSWTEGIDIKAYSRPPLLLIASSPSGLHLIHHLPGKIHVGSVVLPAGATEDCANASTSNGSFSDLGTPEAAARSVYDVRIPRKQSLHLCEIYASGEGRASVILVAVEASIAPERVSSWTRAVLDAVAADRVVFVAMLQREHFRGRVSADDEAVFRLETDALRLEEDSGSGCATTVHGHVPFFPSGSLVSGLPAAVLSRCQLLGLRGRLLLTWPESWPSAPAFLARALKEFPDTKCLDFSPSLQVPFKGKSVLDLDIYM